MSSPMARRSSSSMVVLALLGIDRWTPHELVRHLTLSMIHHIWPWAESKVYEEPKRLVAAGHAKATVDRNDPRRTRYTISARVAASSPNGSPSPVPGCASNPRAHSSALRRERHPAATPRHDRLHASRGARRRRPRRRRPGVVLTQGPPYPDRIHLSVLIQDLVLRINTAVIEWADLTEQRVDDWPELKPDDTMRAAAIDLVHELHQRARSHRATH